MRFFTLLVSSYRLFALSHAVVVPVPSAASLQAATLQHFVQRVLNAHNDKEFILLFTTAEWKELSIRVCSWLGSILVKVRAVPAWFESASIDFSVEWAGCTCIRWR